jgi:hypothetical protein
VLARKATSWILLTASTAWVVLTPVHGARAEEIDEAKALKVQAAYLYNFAKFVEWSDEAFRDEKSPFVIGVLGDDPFGEILDDTVRGKKVAQRAVNVRRLQWRNPADRAGGKDCHIVFVCDSERHRLKEILAEWVGQPVLLVAGIPDFARDGGMIGFVLENQRIIFEINRKALEEAGLRASAGLLKLARIVEPAQGLVGESRRVGSGS